MITVTLILLLNSHMTVLLCVNTVNKLSLV